jgi:hypothetical protein
MSFGYDPRYANEVPDNECLPNGKYQVVVSDIEDKENKNRTGNYLKLTLTVLGGQYKNWKVTDVINYKNENVKAQEMAWRTLKTIAKVVFGRDDQHFGSADLINRKLIIETKIEDDGQYQNARVKKYCLPEDPNKDVQGYKAPPARAPSANNVRPQPPQYENEEPPF